MSDRHGREPEENIRGSGYFDKSVDSFPVSPPPTVEVPRTDSQGDTSGSGQDATSYLDDFLD